jgi:hypothetical protein
MDDGPDLILGACLDCDRLDRLFEFTPGHLLCLPCYRDLVDAALETVPYEKEGEDAAS